MINALSLIILISLGLISLFLSGFMLNLTTDKNENFDNNLTYAGTKFVYIREPSDPGFRYIKLDNNSIEVPMNQTWTNSKKFYK